MKAIYKFLLVIMSCFIISCTITPDVEYNYNDETTTIGLRVEPSVLEFTNADVGDTKSFSLYFSPDELTYLGIDDPSSLDSSIFGVPKMDPEAIQQCKNKAAVNGVCLLTIHYKAKSETGNYKGSLKLKFLYNNDVNQSIKYHIIEVAEKAK